MGIYKGPPSKQRNPRAVNMYVPPIPRIQTTLGYGNHHFSRTHSRHRVGSTKPIQCDFGLRVSNRRFRPLVGVSSPRGLSVQTKQFQFKRRC